MGDRLTLDDAIPIKPEELPQTAAVMRGLGNAGAGYDTQLTPEQQKQFEAWKANLPPALQNSRDYDLQGAFLANAKEAGNGHMTDQFKKPNHMTFSDGSQYDTPATPAGHWGDTGLPNPQQPGQHAWVFSASPHNLQEHPLPELADYFAKYEKGNTLIAPINYRMPAGLGSK